MSSDKLPEDLDEDFLADGAPPKFDFKSLKKDGVGLWTRLLLRFAPFYGMLRLSREFGIEPELAEKLHQLFKTTEKIHLVPSKSGMRGFQIIIDGSTSIFFYQNGDHFEYDGFEVGEYEDGEVTVLDR